MAPAIAMASETVTVSYSETPKVTDFEWETATVPKTAMVQKSETAMVFDFGWETDFGSETAMGSQEPG
jgi:hypothetical protein